MNKNLHRLVFNVARGILVAVQETARSNSQHQGTCHARLLKPVQESQGWATTSHAAPHVRLPTRLSASLLAWALIPAAYAQIVADPTAPGNQRPTILQTSDGKPLVNIQTPSEAGVSRNTYQQFDVQANGAILNNQRGSNPWLAKGEAKVILNEVRSSNPSYLGGQLAVQGGRAEVIIANPSGINIDGASFSNASRATLTTGTPVMENGQLTGLKVERGTVSVSSKGINTSGVSYTDVLARAVKISGKMQASANDTLSITTGTQTIGYTDGLLETNTGTGAKPTVAIDTAALGGMYAGRILLLATEDGAGVRNAGTLQSNVGSGQLVVTAEGKLENSGVMDAAVTSIATLSGDLNNTGKLQGRQLLIAKAGNDMHLSGSGLAQTTATPANVVLHAERDLNLQNNALIKSLGSTSTNGVTQRGQIALSAGRTLTLETGSHVEANGKVQLNSDGLMSLSTTTLSSQAEDVVAISAEGINARNLHATGQTVHLETGAPFRETDANILMGNFHIQGAKQATLIASGNLVFVNELNHKHADLESTQGNVHLQAGKTLFISPHISMRAMQDMSLISEEKLFIDGWKVFHNYHPNISRTTKLEANGNLSLSGGQIQLTGDIQLAAQKDLSIEALQQEGITLQAQHAYHETAAIKLNAEKTLNISAYEGTITAEGLHATAGNASLVSRKGTTVKALTAQNPQSEPMIASTLESRGNLIVGSTEGNVQIQASSLLAEGHTKIVAQGAIETETLYDTYIVPTPFKVPVGPLQARISASDITLQAGTNVSIKGSYFNARTGDLSIIAENGSATLQDSADLNSRLYAGKNLALHSKQAASLNSVSISSSGGLGITSAESTITSLGNYLSAGDILSFSSKRSQNHANGTYAGGALSVYNETGPLKIDNSNLKTSTAKSTNIKPFSGQLSLESGGTITIDTSPNSGTASKFSAQTDLTILAGTGDITLVPEGTSLFGTGLHLHASQLSAGRDLNIATREGALTLLGIPGTQGNTNAKTVSLNAQGNLTLGGATVNIQGANLKSNANLSITSYTGSLLIDGIKNNFSNYVPAQRILQLQQLQDEVQQQLNKIWHDPEYIYWDTKAIELEPIYYDKCARSRRTNYCTSIADQWDEALARLAPYDKTARVIESKKFEIIDYINTISKPAKGYENLGTSIQGRNINLTSASGIAIFGSDILSSGKIEIQSTGALPQDKSAPTNEQKKPIGIHISGLSDLYQYGDPNTEYHAWALFSTPARIQGASDTTIQAVGTNAQSSLVINDSEITSSLGKVLLQSRGDLRLEAGQEEFYSYSSRSYKTGKWYKKKKVTKTETNQDTTASPTVIKGQDISIKSGESVVAEATVFDASQNNIHITAANALNLYAVPEITYSQVNSQKKSSLLGISTGKNKSTTTREIASQLPTHLIASSSQTNSGWDTLLQGTLFDTLQGASINVGVGANARADARIIMEGIKRRVTETRTKEGNYVVWQRTLNAGSITETLAMPKFTGPVSPVFNGTVLADIPDGDFKTELTKLARQPGYEYLDVLAQRNDVNWQPVQLAFEQWHESQEGLTPAGAALLAVVVTAATHGTGASLLGSAGSKTVIVNGVATTSFTTAGLMANAAITSLAAQASITLVNNQGDIGKTLKDLSNSDTARAALAAAITAGAMANVAGLDGMQGLANGSTTTERLAFNLINASGRALTYAAINGDELTEAIKKGLIGGLIDTAHGEIARSYIKDLRDSTITNQVLHKVAHAMAGCTAGSIAGGSCRDGAIGAAVAEIVAEFFIEDVPSLSASTEEWTAFDNKVKAYGKFVAGSIAAYIGGDAQTAITTAETAYDNNGRLAMRTRAAQQQISPQQYYLNLRGQDLATAIIARGGRVPDRMTNPNSPVQFTQNEVTAYENLLRTLDPHSPLIARLPSNMSSPIPDAYVNWNLAVNMNNISTGRNTNAFGFNRDGTAFFRVLLQRQPEMFSEHNQRNINNGLAPIIDQQWIRYNSTHQNFEGQTLTHHHWMQGNIAIPLPQSIHRKWYQILHPYK